MQCTPIASIILFMVIHKIYTIYGILVNNNYNIVFLYICHYYNLQHIFHSLTNKSLKCKSYYKFYTIYC